MAEFSEQNRKSRRSWFDKKPQAVKLEIACEQPKPKKKRRSSLDEIETLELTHFSKPPRVNFGKVTVNQHKTRQLLIRNPHDYEQHVVLERVPEKKYFSISITDFIVEANGHFFLDIVWKPEQAGNYREMVQFLVDDVYRLHTIVYGMVADPPKKKLVRRRVMVGSRAKHPLTVIQTASLTNVQQSYTPKRRSSIETILDSRHEFLENCPPEDSSKKDIPAVGVVDKLISASSPPRSLQKARRCMRRSVTYSKLDKSNELIDSAAESTAKSSASAAEVSPVGQKNSTSAALAADDVFQKSPEVCTPLKRMSLSNMSLSTLCFSPSPLQCSSPRVPPAREAATDHTESRVYLAAGHSLNVSNVHLHQDPDTSMSDGLPSIVSPNTFLQDMLTPKPATCRAEMIDDSFLRDTQPQPEANLPQGLHSPHNPVVTNAKPPTITPPLINPNFSFKQYFQDSDAQQFNDIVTGRYDEDQSSTQKKFSSKRFHWNRSPKKALFSDIPHTPSPRRTTFVVNKSSKKPTPRNSVKKVGAKVFNRFKAVIPSRKMTSSAAKTKETCMEKFDVTEGKLSVKFESDVCENPNRVTMVIEPEGSEGLKFSDATINFGREDDGDSERAVTAATAATADVYDDDSLDKSRVSVDQHDGVTLAVENITDVARCQSVTPATVDNITRFTSVTPATVDDVDRCQSVTLATVDDVDRCQSVTLATVDDVARCQSVTPATVDDVARFQSVTPATVDDVARCQSVTPATVDDVARCQSVTPAAVDDVARCQSVTPATVDDVARFQSVTPAMVDDVARFQSVTITKDNTPVVDGSNNIEVSRRLFNPDTIISSHNATYIPSDMSLDPTEKIANEEDRGNEVLYGGKRDVSEGGALLPNDAQSPVTDTFVVSPWRCTSTFVKSPVAAMSRPQKEKLLMFVSLDGESNGEAFNVSTALAAVRGTHQSRYSGQRSVSHGRQTWSVAGNTVKHDAVKRDAVKHDAVKHDEVKRKSSTDDVKLNKCKTVSKNNASSVPTRPRLGSQKGVASTRLVLMRKDKTAVPRHPMPFAAKNMYYDERWMEKQERGFVKWLNFILTPPDDCASNSHTVKVDIGKVALTSVTPDQGRAPTREVLSLRAYSARRRLNQLRRAACRLFQSDTVVRVVRRLEAEIEAGRLVVRSDKMIHADLGIKQRILDVVLSYNSLWLRIGLETIFGELILLQSNQDVHGLSQFVVTRFLSDADIAAEFAHPTVPHLYRPGYQEAICKHTLKKFLLLVFFLDQAKTSRLIQHDPCLFCKDAQFKTSREYLIFFSKNYLSGEGDVTKHLSYIGYAVSHAQTALDEYEYAVVTLAKDLRDGVRLARVMEHLTGDASLHSQLRAPAISRLQKIHNVQVAFKAFAHRPNNLECAADVEPRHIVDGNREKTLSVLWSIIFTFQVECLIDEAALQHEIDALRVTLCVKRNVERLTERGSLTESVTGRRESSDLTTIYKSGLTLLLLQWCQAVCAFYNIPVDNFTVSFGDGRVLCHLLHHYYPSIMSRDDIAEPTMTSYHSRQSASDADDSCGSPWTESIHSGEPGIFERLLNNEKQNFKTLYEKVSDLGGVPLMLRAVDMSNTIPDEKVVITYVAYLCARLLDIRREVRAARLIQLAWRRFTLRRLRSLTQQKKKKEEKAVVVIQSFCRRIIAELRYRKLRRSCIIIQRCVRKWLVVKGEQRRLKSVVIIQQVYRASRERRGLLMDHQSRERAALTIQGALRRYLDVVSGKRVRAALTIQRGWRVFVVRKALTRDREASVKIQKHYRGHVTRRKFLAMRAAAVVIQRWFRGVKRAKDQRNWLVRMKRSVRVIEKAWLEYKVRWEKRMRWRACLMIQSYVRGRKQRLVYREMVDATLLIQRQFRRVRCSRNKLENDRRRRAVEVISRTWVQYQTRRTRSTQRAACVKIQAMWRGYAQKRDFRQLKQATVLIQQRYRARLYGKRCRLAHVELVKSVVIIQNAWKAYRVRKTYKRQLAACVCIQSQFRMHRQRKIFEKTKSACVKLQFWWRAMKQVREERGVYLKNVASAVVIQAAYRGYSARLKYSRECIAVVTLQSQFRRYRTAVKYRALRLAAVIIQRGYRGVRLGRQIRSDYLIKKRSVVKIQRAWRAYKDRKIQTTVTTIQSAVRTYLVRRQLVQTKASILLIQSFVRKIVARRTYTDLRGAVLAIQTRYRAVKLMQAHQRDYERKKRAAVMLQSCFRMYSQRSRYDHRVRLITELQAAARGMLERKRLLRLTAACIIIQTLWRSRRQCRKARLEYTNKKRAAITIQTYFRRHLAREILVRNTSATIIQAHFRGYCRRVKYQAVRMACVKIQSIVRMVRCRKRFVCQKQAAIAIQSRVRAMRCRTELCKLKRATVTIQTYYQSYKLMVWQREEYIKIKRASVTIQKYYRDCINRRESKRRLAAVKLQAAFRGKQARDMFKKMRAAVIIQSYFKAAIARKLFLEQRSSAIVIQTRYRGYAERKVFVGMRQAAVSIQSIWRGVVRWRRKERQLMSVIQAQAIVRGYLIRSRMKKRAAAAVCIQSVWRMYRDKVQYLSIKSSSVLIQSFFRKTLVRKHLREEEELKILSVLVLQGTIRCWSARRLRMKQLRAVLCIQRSIRGYQQRCRYLEEYECIVKVQRRFRATLEAKHCYRHFWLMKNAAITIQQIFRSYLIAEDCARHSAATVIQSAWRGHIVRQVYLEIRGVVVKLQSWHRMVVKRRAFHQELNSVCFVQRKARACLEARKMRRSFLEMSLSALKIQSVFRGYRARMEYKKRVTGIVRLEALARGFIHRQRVKKAKSACLVIEEWYMTQKQCKCDREVFLKQRHASVTIQRAYRQVRSARQCHQLKVELAAVAIQSWWRMEKERRAYTLRKSSAVVIQSCVRGWFQQKQYQADYRKLLKLQTEIRAWLCGVKCRRESSARFSAAVKIQSWFKMVVQREQFWRARRNVVVIQSVVRRFLCRVKYRMRLEQHRSAVCIQKYVRGARIRAMVQRYKVYRARRLASFIHDAQRHLAAVTIQRSVRCHQVRVRSRLQSQAAVTIQHWLRGRLARLGYLKTLASIAVIQRCVRGWLYRRRWAVNVIQNCVRAWSVHRRNRVLHEAATRVQAWWRGLRVRSATTKRVSLARKRIEVANQAATKENTLGSRTTTGIDYLLRYKHLSYILLALKHLDVTTRLSALCCERLVQIDALPVIFHLMSNCNRSLPHMDLLKYAINILLNLVKYEKTRQYVYHIEGSVTFLVDLMQIYRDKGVLFYKTCTLVGLLAADVHNRLEMRSDKRLMDRLLSIYNLTARKHRIEEKRQQVKTRINISMTTFNCTLPLATPMQTMVVEPEWVLRRDSIHDINDAMTAITFVVDNLGVRPKKERALASTSTIQFH